MNTHAPIPALEAATAPLLATFRVRARTAMSFTVERAVTGGDTIPAERPWHEVGRAYSEGDANRLAEQFAAKWRERTGAAAVVVPLAAPGRRTGQAYASWPREADEPGRLLASEVVDCGRRL